MTPIAVAPYPGLHVEAFRTRFPRPLAETPAPPALAALLSAQAEAPFTSTDAVRLAVRDLLRVRGYKPTGRGKPASEFLLRAASEGSLGPINAAVDACNAVSLHSGLPISVVDLVRARAPFRVDVPGEDAEFVFNASGQSIRVGGLLCLFDAEGPCANAVRDSQRTKTHEGTTETLSLVWAPETLSARASEACRWYQDLLGELGAETEGVGTGV